MDTNSHLYPRSYLNLHWLGKEKSISFSGVPLATLQGRSATHTPGQAPRPGVTHWPAQTELNDAFTKVGGDREVGRVGRWRTNWKELGQRDKDDQNILHDILGNE